MCLPETFDKEFQNQKLSGMNAFKLGKYTTQFNDYGLSSKTKQNEICAH